MRGGLGRTLLSAFLLLTIVPLAVISFLAISWVRRDLREEVVTRLTAVARLKEAEIEAWMTASRSELEALADSPGSRGVFLALLPGDPRSVEARRSAVEVLEAAREGGALEEIGLFGVEGRLAAATDMGRLASFAPGAGSLAPVCLADPATGRPAVVLEQAIEDDRGEVRGYLVGLADLAVLEAIMEGGTDLGETGESYLVGAGFVPLTRLRGRVASGPGEEGLRTAGVEAGLAGREGADVYTGYEGEPVVGVYGWLPLLQVALVVEQGQGEAFARYDALATLLLGATLGVALLTTLLAAVITRQLSRPIVELTLTAVKIAGGDLGQEVTVGRRDEIGILAQAFNVMTAELRALYGGLEQKVAERTLQLRKANQQLRYQAMQLALSAEVGRAITSTLDLDALLERVVELIRNSHRLLRVSIYLLDEGGRRVVRQARTGWDGTCVRYTGVQAILPGSLLGRAVAGGEPQLDERRTSLVIPLRAGQRVIGALNLQAYQGDELFETNVGALQSLGDQISVAVQNAQTFAVERNTVERLHRLDQVRTQSLGNMSRELATSLNSIIGFSRLILKGVDGPLTEEQHSDVSAINRSGLNLLGLLDDILELVDLESGDHPLEQGPVALDRVVAEVIDQVAPLAEGRAITVRAECAADLPVLQADGARLQQALVYLVSNAIEKARDDAVTVGAWVAGGNGGEVMVSVSSGAGGRWFDGGEGVGSPTNDLPDRYFAWDGTGSGVKLILSRRIIELHGGCLWVNNGPARPVTFVFTLPVGGRLAGCPYEVEGDESLTTNPGGGGG